MDTEKLLKELFDLQRFEQEPTLQSVLDEVEARYFGEALTDDTMHQLSAAGEPFSQSPDPKNWSRLP